VKVPYHLLWSKKEHLQECRQKKGNGFGEKGWQKKRVRDRMPEHPSSDIAALCDFRSGLNVAFAALTAVELSEMLILRVLSF
jgi:hypothetical protein